jgi:DNA-binding transcriptional LysR family regulator
MTQPALSRQVQELEDELGVDLFRRSSGGVTLTAEGKLFLTAAREALTHIDESVEQVRALARGEYGELHVGYAPIPTAEILPPALAAFRKAVPRVKLSLHDFSSDEIIDGLREGTLQIGVLVEREREQATGVEFEPLRTYPYCVVMPASHPFARLKSIPVEKLATQQLVVLRRKEYPGFHSILARIFAPISAKPRIAVECDGSASLVAEVEAGHGLLVATPLFRLVAAKRLILRSLDTTEVQSVGIARAAKGDVTPAGEKFCEILRKISGGPPQAKPSRS